MKQTTADVAVEVVNHETEHTKLTYNQRLVFIRTSIRVSNALSKRALSGVLAKYDLKSLDYSVVAEKILTDGKLEGKGISFKAVGVLADIVIGSLSGIGLARVYATTPPGNEAIKGALGGGLIWGLSLMVGTHTGILKKVKSSEMLTTLVIDTLFGAGLGFIIGRKQARVITQSHPVLVKVVSDDRFNEERLRVIDKPLSDVSQRTASVNNASDGDFTSFVNSKR
jgi:hypothetical protein